MPGIFIQTAALLRSSAIFQHREMCLYILKTKPLEETRKFFRYPTAVWGEIMPRLVQGLDQQTIKEEQGGTTPLGDNLSFSDAHDNSLGLP